MHWTDVPLRQHVRVVSVQLCALGLLCVTGGIRVQRQATPEDVAEQLLSLLPDDGSPVPNRIMLAMIVRRLEARVHPEVYAAVVGSLADRGRIGRSRGQGGKVFLVHSPELHKPPEPQLDAWSELALMAKLATYLAGPFRQLIDLPSDAAWIVADTSTIGPRSGQWARPDFVAVSAMHFGLLPGCQVDVHSFELKAENGGAVQAVHEALAQTRFTHFGHLVWHVPEHSRAEARLPEIEQHCEAHGIGLVIIRDPNDHDTWEVRLDPERKSTTSATIDAFLQSRFSEDQQAALTRAISI